MLVLNHDVRRHNKGSFGSTHLGTIVADADDRALASRERLAEVRHQLGLGQVT